MGNPFGKWTEEDLEKGFLHLRDLYMTLTEEDWEHHSQSSGLTWTDFQTWMRTTNKLLECYSFNQE